MAPTPTHKAETVDRSSGERPELRVIVNARASGSRHRDRVDRLAAALRRYGAAAEFIFTESVDQLAEIWKEDDGRRIVLMGGDGTIHVAPRLGEPLREVALIPAGRANNVARSLGIPLDLESAARLAVKGSARPIDLIEARADGRRHIVMESVSVGFLAQARVRYRGRNSADLVAGVRAGAAALARFHPLAAHVHSPSSDETIRLAQLFVANLPLYEFGLRIAPDADPTDATLDVIGIEAPNRRAVLRMVGDLRRGTYLEHLRVHSWRTPSMTLRTNGASPIVGDSADLGVGPIELRALPAALRIVRP